MRYLSLFALLTPCILWSMLIGNPGQPLIQKYGVLQSCPTWWSLRAGYLSDFIYRAKFKDEFPSLDTPKTSSYVQLSTDAALLTLNIKNVFDFYGIVGSAAMQLDHEVYTNKEFAWGVGGKFIFFRSGSIRLGADFKYFETDQKPLYFVSDALTYNVESDFHLRYSETQVAVGAAYRTKLLSPYLQVTYLISKLDPHPYVAAVRIPLAEFADTPADIDSKSVIGSKRWGLAVGATIISGSKGSLTLESRMINQNAVDLTGEIRF
ncbi:MAG: hypothetical protein Q8L98_07515 [Chlamydiales bacterium]|nr:hypothetical protein [Chlamydiales bacterium]